MIREAYISDDEELAKLMTILGYPSDSEAMKVRLKRIVNDPYYQTFVFEKDKKLLGMIGMTYSLAYHTSDTHVRVIAFVVDEHAQGKGIGRSLMGKAEEWTLSKGANRITLNSGNRSERDSAHSVYHRLGFEGKATGFYKDL
ncbi:GNAT family N-acetyltransferase [Halobacillus campisalis]|uniref:GNAT family N-acetyltransferase n=1 Tax=Halobacillus campisalis TaxID=435909 RepID=A0ABW2K9R6_9BACI|nr:GNAT family N-acetyltransferase [Halobacillus campisalis]